MKTLLVIALCWAALEVLFLAAWNLLLTYNRNNH